MPVFDADRPLRVAVLFSGGASGFRYLADEDPNYGDAYEVVCAFCTDPDAPGIAAVRDCDVPVESRDLRAFYEDRDAELSDLSVREAYDRRTRETVAAYDPDLILLSGYMWILTAPVVEAFPVLNVHPADLTVREDGDRKYVGADPVFDAVVAGDDDTRSTVHFVTTAVDEGPILARSRPFEVHRELVADLQGHDAEAGLRDYADAHQEWMKWEGDGPAIATALELVATGRVDRDGATVRIDGEAGFFDLGEGGVLDG
jgi:folate-dependent phosphoribosylglycinamide formyltransferase PurN